MIKILFMLFINTTLLLSNSIKEDIANWDKLSKESILKQFEVGFSKLLSKNGKIKTGQNEYLVNVSTNLFPPTIFWSIEIDIEKQMNDYKAYIRNNFKDETVTFKNKMLNRIDRNFILKQLVNNQNYIINYNCSREDYKYLYSRDISMIYQYIETDGRYLHRLEVDEKKCNSFKINRDKD